MITVAITMTDKPDLTDGQIMALTEMALAQFEPVDTRPLVTILRNGKVLALTEMASSEDDAEWARNQ